MKAKTLLIAAAALAAGVISSQAQTPVYSQNIVGYVNQPLVLGYSSIANPLDNSAGNSLTNIFPNTGALDGATVYMWNGAGYTIVTLDSGMPTGVGDAADLNPVPAPVINPGQLFYFNNNTAGNVTNVFVGTVHVDGSGSSTNTVGVTTNSLPIGYSFVASKIPVGGGISSALGLVNTGGALDGATVYTPLITGGNFTGYKITTFDSGMSTGFGDAADLNPVAEPVVPVGAGFIFNNNTAGAAKWIQSF